MFSKEEKEKLIEGLKKLYKDINESDILFSFCPYRVCPVGAHIDHQLGKVTGFAINRGITIAYFPNNNSLFEATSLNFDGVKNNDILNIGEKQNDWADYLRGTAKLLYEKYGITKGINCVINGSLPIGGVSSSAAVVIAFMNALCEVNNLKLTNEEVISLAQEVENKYVGVNSGRLDQSCEVLSKKGNLLSLDIGRHEYELIPQNPNMLPYKIGIFFSGVKRTLVGSAYNNRVEELKMAANLLRTYGGVPCTKYEDTYLRDVPRDLYRRYGDKLPENLRKRAEHYYSEMSRVGQALHYWDFGDIKNFGKVVFESGDSSIKNYEAGSKELKVLHHIMKQTKGVYGGRMSGAGFKGCYLGIINPDYEESIKEEVTRKYLEMFPEHNDTFEIFYCDTADGLDIENKTYVKTR